MGGNSRQKKSSTFSVFSFFKFRKAGKGRDRPDMDDGGSRVWPSDEDRVRWVADPAIDKKAQEFIAKIHRNIVSDSEPHIVTVNPARNV